MKNSVLGLLVFCLLAHSYNLSFNFFGRSSRSLSLGLITQRFVQRDMLSWCSILILFLFLGFCIWSSLLFESWCSSHLSSFTLGMNSVQERTKFYESWDVIPPPPHGLEVLAFLESLLSNREDLRWAWPMLILSAASQCGSPSLAALPWVSSDNWWVGTGGLGNWVPRSRQSGWVLPGSSGKQDSGGAGCL